MPLPAISVIVPAYNAAAMLRDTLAALRRSTLPADRWELIVADDGSTDDSSLVAAEFADTVLRLAGRAHGPAYARNRASEVARGDVLVFVDADARVHPDALARIAEVMAGDPTIGALFGSYDDQPEAPGLVSRYRNLLHHYVHHRNAGDAETFWAGLGAVRRDLFRRVDMFNEWHYSGPEIEDIELGRRLRAAGHRIVLRPEIQCTHLKRWTLRSMLRADLGSRGIPWMWLIIAEGPNAGSEVLNVRRREKWCTAAASLGAVLLLAALLTLDARLAAAGLALSLGVAVANAPLHLFFLRKRGPLFALAAAGLHTAYYLLNAVSVICGWLVHVMFEEPTPPPIVSAAQEMGVRVWPPVPRPPDAHAWSDRPRAIAAPR